MKKFIVYVAVVVVSVSLVFGCKFLYGRSESATGVSYVEKYNQKD